MLDPTNIPTRDADVEVREQFLDDVLSGIIDGMRAARAVANGGPPDVDVLHEYAQALEVLRVGDASCNGFLEPTEDDVRSVRHLVQLVRDGAPRDALIEPARRAERVVADGWELERFQSALICLEDDASRIQHFDRIREVLDLSIALFARGCRAAGFVSTPADVVNVKRLREIMAAEGAQAEEERLRLVRELEARLPLSGGIQEPETAPQILYLDR